MIKARAAITDGREGFFFDEVDVDSPQKDEVLVELHASGVCHTDWDIKRNAKKPIVMGHEGAGVVLETGPDVSDLKPGDRVALNWSHPCGHCFQCAHGNATLCEEKVAPAPERSQYRGEPIMRAFGLGTMATHTVVARPSCVKIDVEMPFPAASIIGCGVMTGMGSVLNAAKVEPGTSVVVLGTGGVGLNCLQGARIAGAATIIGVDVNPGRLEMARQFGATHVIQADKDDDGLLCAAEVVREITGGRGADYAFECTAVPELGAAPLAMVRNGGTAVQASGIEEPIEFNMELFEWDKLYINPLYGKCVPERDFPRLFHLYAAKLLQLDEMITRTYRLEDLEKAFDDMHAGRNAKGVLALKE